MKFTTRKQITITEDRMVSPWMEFALKGEKINAIKELRSLAGAYEGRHLSLLQAKTIVESVMTLSTSYQSGESILSIELVI